MTLLGVQPSPSWMLRSGRFWPIRNSSLWRTASICPVMSLAASEASATTTGASCRRHPLQLLHTRALRVVGNRDGADQATPGKGAMQLERTLKRDISSPIDFDRPTMPSFASGVLAWPRLPIRPEVDVMWM